jgi:hypothetical protein
MTPEIKKALDLALDALEICEQDGYIPVRLTRDALTAIKQARSAPVQEPDGHMHQLLKSDGKPSRVFFGAMCKDSKEIIVSARIAGETDPAVFPFYTTPPAAQRTWVGLTVNERGKVYADWRWSDGRTSNLALCEAIETKLREKNNGVSQTRESP